MALTALTIGTLLFVLVHLIPMVPGWRADLVGRVGEGAYKSAFTVVSVVGLFGAIIAYRFAPHTPLWEAPPPLRLLALITMLASIVCFVCAKNTPWFRRVVRHPMLWGIGLLGVAHLIANGELAGLILFGGLALFGFAWQPLTDRRDAEADPSGWAETARTTSFWPFAKWGAQGDGAPPLTLRPILIAVIAYLVLILAHPWLFGASAVPWW